MKPDILDRAIREIREEPLNRGEGVTFLAVSIVAVITLAALVVIVVAALLFTYSGRYNVSALSSSGGILDWWAGAAMEHSVRAHASAIVVPNLNDSSLIVVGFDHYREMCIACHGSPDGGMSEAGMGLNPKAPDLSEAARLEPANPVSRLGGGCFCSLISHLSCRELRTASAINYARSSCDAIQHGRSNRPQRQRVDIRARIDRPAHSCLFIRCVAHGQYLERRAARARLGRSSGCLRK